MSDIFEVDSILGKKYNHSISQFEYLIRWKDFKNMDSTWEPLDNLKNIRKMVQEFD